MKNYATFLHLLAEELIKSGVLVRGRFGQKRRQKSGVFLVRLAVGQEPRPEVQCHHDRIYVIDMEPAEATLDSFQTANGSVLSCKAVPLDFLVKIVFVITGHERFCKINPPTQKESESLVTKKANKSADRQGKPGAVHR